MIAAIVVGLAAPAQFAFSLSGSVGSGYELAPDVELVPTNVMLAPGFDVLVDFLRVDAGVALDLPQNEAELELQLRPSLIVSLPILPFYGRLTIGAANVLHGPLLFMFGAGAGFQVAIGPEYLFAEVDFLPRAVRGSFFGILEGRLGFRLTF